MSEIQLGIKITADGGKATAALDQIGNSTKKVGQDIASLNAGWAKLNDQFAKQTAAKAWADQLAQASQAAQKLKQSTENAEAAWAKFSQQGMQRLEATAWANKLAQATHQAAQAATVQTQATQKQEQSLSALAITLGKVYAGYIAIRQVYSAVLSVTRTADTYTNLNSRLKLVSGTTQELARAQAASFEIAQRYNMALDDTGRLYTRLAPIAQNLGRSQADLITLMTGVGAAMKVSGATAAEAGSTITQLTQSLAAATVQGSDFNLLYDTAPAIVRAVEKELSGLVQQYGSLKNAMEKGAVSNQMLFDVLVKTSAEFQRQAATMSLTVGGALQNLTNAWTRYIGETDQAKGSSRDLADGLQRLANNIDTVMYIPSKIVNGWGLLAEGIERAVKATRELFSLQPNAGVSTQMAELQKYRDQYVENQAISREEWEARKKNNQGYFDGIRRGADAAAIALRGLNEEQQRVARQIIDAAKAAKLDPALALAVAQTESRFRQSARSPVGAMGVMQLMPETARGLGVNPANEQENIQGGIKYLKQLQGEFKTLTQIAAGYNAGPGNVRNDKWMRFAETRDYVQKVTAAYQQFKAELSQDDGFNVAREQFDSLRYATQRYINNLDDQAKAAQRQAEVAISGIDNQIAALDRERDAWDKSQQDKIDAAKGSYDAMARLEAERAATLQDYAARELALIQQQYDARKQAMEASAAAFRKQLDSPNQLTDDEERRAKQGLADIQADLVKLANDRAQAEAKAGQAALEANRGGLELAQKQRAFIANINADLEFQKQLYIQLKAAKEAGASAEGLSLIAGAAEQSRQLPGTVSAEQIMAMDRAIAQRKIYEQQTADLMQTEQDRTESVREQQLRENAYWDQLINRMEQYANTWQEITGSQNDAFSRLAIQTHQYAKSIKQIGNAYEDLKKKQGDPAGALGIAEGAAQAQAALNLMAQTMLALRSQYEEGSKGYENMTAAAERMMEVQRALQLVEAVLGVVHQATAGDPYTAIPRMIGVAAMMASMGLQTGAGGSANASVKYAAVAGQQDSGVFGDPSKPSESIAKSLEVIRDNSSNDLNYSAAMLRALEGIEAAMSGVTNTVIRGLTPASVSGLGSKVPEGLNTFNKVMNTMFFGPAGFFAADFLNKALAPLTKILFNVTRKISDFGIAASQQALSDILTKGFSGQVYTDIETTTKMLGITVSKSVKTAFSDLDPTIAREFTRAFASIRRAIIEGGKAFDLTAADFNQRLKGFVVDMGKISTKDLTGEQLQEKITQMFNEQSDRIARRFMPKLGPFQQVGEGYFYTFTRVAEAVNRAGGELERLGITAINFRDVVDKQAPDIAAEIFRQSVIQAEGMSSVAALMQNASGTLQEMKDYFTNLIEIRQSLRTAGLGEIMSEAMINRAGGADAFAQSLNVYLEEFLTPSERLIGQWQNIGDAFTALGIKMPTTNAEFRTLVESIDVSTEAGQKLRGAVIGLAPAFADLTSAMNDAMPALQDAYNTAKEQIKSLRDYLASLKTGDMASGSPMDRYRAAQQQYEDLLRRYNAGDVSVTPDMLQSAASTYLSLSKQIFAGTTQYASDVQRVESSLSGIAGKLDAQISKAAAQVPALESNTGAVNSLSAALATYTETMGRVGEIISGQKINGASIDDINAGNNQDAADKAARDAKEQEAQAFEKRLAEMTRDLRYAREHGQDNKADKIKADIEAYIAQIQASGVFSVAWDGKRHDVSYRAKGGYTPPGWTVVGEQGPELVNFSRPAQVYTAAQTREALRPQDDGKTFAALEAIKDEMRALVRTQSGANPAIIGELQALRARMDQLERNQRIRV